MPAKNKRSRSPTSATSARKTSKKDKKDTEPVDPVTEKVNEIIKCIKTFQKKDTKSNADLNAVLIESAKVAFKEPKDKRHKHSQTYVHMIDNTLVGYHDEYSKLKNDKIKEIQKADEDLTEKQNIKNELIEQFSEIGTHIANKQYDIEGLEDDFKLKEKEFKEISKQADKDLAPLKEFKKNLASAHEHKKMFEEMRQLEYLQSVAPAEKKKK